MAARKKMIDDGRRYHIIRVNDNNEQLIETHDDITIAKDRMLEIGKRNHQGTIAVVFGKLTESGKIDFQGREEIDLFDWFLFNLNKRKLAELHNN